MGSRPAVRGARGRRDPLRPRRHPAFGKMASHRDLSGIVQPGRGLGAGLMADGDLMGRLRELAGFRSCPAPSTCACRNPSSEARAGATCLPLRSARTGRPDAGRPGISGTGHDHEALPRPRLSSR
jgi:hypothetical protein